MGWGAAGLQQGHASHATAQLWVILAVFFSTVGGAACGMGGHEV